MVYLKTKIKHYTWQLKKDASSSELWKGVYLSHFFQFQNNNNNNNNNIVNTKNNRTNSEFTYKQQHALLIDPFFCSSKQINTNSVKDSKTKTKTPFYLFIQNNRTHTEIALKQILFNWAAQIGRPNHKFFTYRNSIKADTI